MGTVWRRTRRVGVVLAAAAVALGSAQAAVAAPAAAHAPADPAQYVNPFLGTQPGAADQGTGGGAGNDFPGADVPFGMVQWSPDTVTLQHGGYYYQDNRIRGFSLTHLSGAGCDTYEDIPFMPVTTEVTDSPATDPGKYISTFSHANEKATPGYYGVTLDNGVKTELTVTQRTGDAQFAFPSGKPATLLVNTSGSVSGADDSQITIGKDSISGWAASGHFCGANDHYRVYFYAKFNQRFASIGTWKNGAVTPGSARQRGSSPAKPGVRQANEATALRSTSVKPRDTTVSGPGSGGYVTFDSSKGKPVNVRLGLSFVSIDGAKGNLRAENNGNRTFGRVAAAAHKTWNARLGEIGVSGGTDEENRTFYSSLYHAFLQPNVYSDSDGKYTGFDGRVHTADRGHAMYTNFSGWDIYRSEIQLLSLLAPHAMSDIVRSMIAYADQGGSWDRWTVAGDYTGVMNGDPYHAIVSTAYAFGARDFDARHALESMVRGATQPTKGYTERPGLPQYMKDGYVPGAAADTLEYTSADFSIAQLARRLGDAATYDTFSKRAQYWQNLYDPATGYLEPRNASGSFPVHFDPASSSGYVEGNGAQYSWMVPYDVAGLVSSLGGNAAANKRLDTFFTQLNAGTSKPYAFLSNEPTLETPWLYDFTGAPYKTQALVRKVQAQLFNSSPSGLQGNDDLGEMGSWYVFSAIGMYPEIPGRAELVLSTPLFSQVRIHTPAGKKITINAPGNSPGTPYTVGLKVDGHTTQRPWLPESFVADGGTLDYTVSQTPDTHWGAAPADAPPSFRDGEVGQRSYVTPSRLVVPDGGTGSAAVGVQDISGAGAAVTWSAAPENGVTVSPSSGKITVAAGQKATQPISVTVAKATAEGSYKVPITFDGGAIPGATLTVLVAQPGSLRAAFDNVGISPDSDTSVAEFDGSGFSYSQDALATAGVNPGGTVTVDGITHTWPKVGTGEPDNVVAAGQTVDLSGAQAGATQLAFLGSASNGEASGAVTVTYTDGSRQQADIGFTDWTRGGGGGALMFGNQIAASTPYRNETSGGSQRIDTYVFATAPIALQAGKRVASVTLPTEVKGGALHIFAITAA